jgi:hypothetical protein
VVSIVAFLVSNAPAMNPTLAFFVSNAPAMNPTLAFLVPNAPAMNPTLAFLVSNAPPMNPILALSCIPAIMLYNDECMRQVKHKSKHENAECETYSMTTTTSHILRCCILNCQNGTRGLSEEDDATQPGLVAFRSAVSTKEQKAQKNNNLQHYVVFTYLIYECDEANSQPCHIFGQLKCRDAIKCDLPSSAQYREGSMPGNKRNQGSKQAEVILR